MDYNRAREILASENIVEVLYQGTPVWIHEVQRNGVTATVSMDKEEMVPVPIRELKEGQTQ